MKPTLTADSTMICEFATVKFPRDIEIQKTKNLIPVIPKRFELSGNVHSNALAD
jgi:hypothetical protein